MKTNLHPKYVNTQTGQDAEKILRSCVHCGFCNATCPTYRQLADERDGPRGRIYLIKQLLESGQASDKTRNHLDKCLTCRSCETTCPSGVEYGKLIDIGRGVIEQVAPRPWQQNFVRWCLRHSLPYQNRFAFLLRIGQLIRPLMPSELKNKIPLRRHKLAIQRSQNNRTMLLLAGCTQPAATPNTNAAATRVLDRLGISLIEATKAGCCGAVSYHLAAHQHGLDFMRRNIDAWWPQIEAGAEAIVISASACSLMVKQYGELLKDNSHYADKAAKVSQLAKDLSEVLLAEDLSQLNIKSDGAKTAVHCPCTMQHGLKMPDNVERILSQLGFQLAPSIDKHLCCGSAGTYSILQPTMSKQLLTNKLKALTVDNPDKIVSANIGCQLYLATQSQVPVLHWIELLDQDI